MRGRANPVATLFPLLLAGFLAGMSYWLELASRPQGLGQDGKSRHDPDYYVENFNVKRFDAEGLLQHTLIADRMQHYPDDDTTLVAAPRMIYHREPATYLSARAAQVDGKGERVELIDAVQVLRAGLNGKPTTTLTTERLEAYPDDEIARTLVPARIVQGLSHVTGNTLESNNKTAIHILEGAVRGTFQRSRGMSGASQPVAQVAAPVARQPQPETRPAAKLKAKSQAKSQAKPKARPKPQAKSQPKPKR